MERNGRGAETRQCPRQTATTAPDTTAPTPSPGLLARTSRHPKLILQSPPFKPNFKTLWGSHDLRNARAVAVKSPPVGSRSPSRCSRSPLPVFLWRHSHRIQTIRSESPLKSRPSRRVHHARSFAGIHRAMSAVCDECRLRRVVAALGRPDKDPTQHEEQRRPRVVPERRHAEERGRRPDADLSEWKDAGMGAASEHNRTRA